MDILSSHFRLGMTPEVDVGAGSGHTEISLELTTEVLTGMSAVATMDLSMETCVVGVCAGASVGFSHGVFLEVSYTAGTIFSSSVSMIPTENYAEHGFEFGLFAHTMQLPGMEEDEIGVPITVVNYFVD